MPNLELISTNNNMTVGILCPVISRTEADCHRAAASWLRKAWTQTYLHNTEQTNGQNGTATPATPSRLPEKNCPSAQNCRGKIGWRSTEPEQKLARRQAPCTSGNSLRPVNARVETQIRQCSISLQIAPWDLSAQIGTLSDAIGMQRPGLKTGATRHDD